MNENNPKTPQYIETISTINNLLQDYNVLNEFIKTRIILSEMRVSLLADPDESHAVKPPRLKFIASCVTSVYDSKLSKIYIGKFGITHEQVLKDNDVSADYDFVHGTKRFFGGDIYTFRGAQKIKIMSLNTLNRFHKKDFDAIQKQGYIIMDYNFNWIVEHGERVMMFPSPLSLTGT